MIYPKEEIMKIAGNTRFRPDIVEKVTHLLELLNTLFSHPFLKDRLVLKGGTALNLFYFDIPRLSVDIDINFTGSLKLDELNFNKPKVEEALRAVFSREDYLIKRIPNEHAGGKWRLGYQSFSGQPGILEVDINYMFRQPLFNPVKISSKNLGRHIAVNIPVLDIHELAAGKLAALFSRHAARDLYDTNRILSLNTIENKKLRTAFIIYGALNRKDWRTISENDILPDPKETERLLLPLLHNEQLAENINASSFTSQMIKECQEKLQAVFPFKKNEKDFLNKFLDKGEIRSELITDDLGLQKIIETHPALNWKKLNVKKHLGLN